MTTSDTIAGVSLGISILALLVAGVSSFGQLRVAQGQMEATIENQVIASRARLEDFLEEHGDFLAKEPTNAEDAGRRDRLERKSKSIIEGYFSTLNSACQKFFDKKIDRKRFKTAYQREVRQVVEHEANRATFAGPHPYFALKKFYDQCENTEGGSS